MLAALHTIDLYPSAWYERQVYASMLAGLGIVAIYYGSPLW